MRTVELAFTVLHEGSTGEASGYDFFPLEFLANLCWDCAEQHDVWPRQHVLAFVLRSVVIHILVVDVVQHGRPAFLVLGYEVDELVGHDGHLVGLTDDSIGPRHEFHAGTRDWDFSLGVTGNEL